MRVTAILTAAERKRQDRSVHRAEERRRRAKMMRVCGPTCPHSSVWAHASAVQAPKRLINKRKLAILTSNGMPLGECRLKAPSQRQSQATRHAALIASFAQYRRFGDDVFWLKENAELLNILECTGAAPDEAALAPHRGFYA